MEPQVPQDSNPQGMTQEEAKASLGLATRLSEQFLMPQVRQPVDDAVEEPQEPATEELGPEMSQTAPEEKPMDIEAFKSDLVKELGSAIKEAVKAEVGGLRKEIEKAINDIRVSN